MSVLLQNYVIDRLFTKFCYKIKLPSDERRKQLKISQIITGIFIMRPRNKWCTYYTVDGDITRTIYPHNILHTTKGLVYWKGIQHAKNSYDFGDSSTVSLMMKLRWNLNSVHYDIYKSHPCENLHVINLSVGSCGISGRFSLKSHSSSRRQWGHYVSTYVDMYTLLPHWF